MEVSSHLPDVEEELKSLGADQIRRERLNIETDLKKLQEQIGDLAFNNYRTYADAGRTAQHCTEIFTEMNTKLKQISGEIPQMNEELKSFFSKSKKLREQYQLVTAAADKSNHLWEILSLPSRMDVCIRSGYYEAAYALTNYGMQLQQTTLINNPLIKSIADKLVEARSFLLEELFNKFAGPLDLAQSIQVVNNVRKIPYLSNTQLRVSVLQYRDIYLDKQILDISTHPEFVLQAIEVYRNCMYDTMVLYLAVFPENELNRRDHSLDPRWEQWSPSSPSAVLSEWSSRNIQRLLDLIHRADMKSQVDMSAVWSKMMSFASSFGRMNLDFRPIIVNSLCKMVQAKFQYAVRQVTQRMVKEVKRVDLLSGDVSAISAFSDLSSPPIPPAELSMWDDLCVYGNGIIEALNLLRYSLSPVLLPSVVSCLRESLRAVFSWLGTQSSSAHFPRAVRILGVHLVSFLNQCILFYFPYATVSRLFGSSITKSTYESYCDLCVRQLMRDADGSENLEEVLLPLIEPTKVDDAFMDEVIRQTREKMERGERRENEEGEEKAADVVIPSSPVNPPMETSSQLPNSSLEDTPSTVTQSAVTFGLSEDSPEPVPVDANMDEVGDSTGEHSREPSHSTEDVPVIHSPFPLPSLSSEHSMELSHSSQNKSTDIIIPTNDETNEHKETLEVISEPKESQLSAAVYQDVSLEENNMQNEDNCDKKEERNNREMEERREETNEEIDKEEQWGWGESEEKEEEEKKETEPSSEWGWDSQDVSVPSGHDNTVHNEHATVLPPKKKGGKDD